MGVPADPVAGAIRQVDRVQGRVDPGLRIAAVVGGAQLKVGTCGQVRVEARRLDEAGHAVQRPRALDVGVAVEQQGAAGGGVISPSIIRRDVVLPAPFGPR